LGQRDPNDLAPEGRQHSVTTLVTNTLSPLRGSQILLTNYPRLAKPRLGLNSDRCSAAGWMFIDSCRVVGADQSRVLVMDQIWQPGSIKWSSRL